MASVPPLEMNRHYRLHFWNLTKNYLHSRPFLAVLEQVGRDPNGENDGVGDEDKEQRARRRLLDKLPFVDVVEIGHRAA